MNGADDVIKYSKYRSASYKNKMIVMCRPGSTTQLLDKMAEFGMPPEGTAHFLVGPELPDISSSLAREASRAGDRVALLKLLHPAVAEWMLDRDGHGSAAEPDEAADAATGDFTPSPPTRSATNYQPQMAIVRVEGDGGVALLSEPPQAGGVDEAGDPELEIGIVCRNELVEILHTKGDFCYVVTDSALEGYMEATNLVRRAEQGMWVRRTDGHVKTSLRKTPTPSRDPENMVPQSTVVNGEFVVVVHYDQGFCYVQASRGGSEVRGYLQTAYLTAAMVAAARTHTLLRREPARRSAWTEARTAVTNGELVGVLGQEGDFLFVHTQSGATGYVAKCDLKQMDWVQASDGSANYFLQPVDV